MAEHQQTFEEDFNPNSSRIPVLGPALDDLDNRLLLGREYCPVCQSMFIAPLRYVFNTQRTHRYLLRACLECRSVWNPPVLLNARGETTLAIPEFPLQSHLDKMERNIGMAKCFFRKIASRGTINSVLDIGCGIGATLKVASDMGMKVCGFDISGTAVEKGRELFGLPLFAGAWTSDSVQESFDLVLCILVLEHMPWPLSLIHELAMYGRRTRSVLFISVPRFLRVYWNRLLEGDPRDRDNIFRASQSHFVHFSEEGLEAAFRKYGCTVHPFYAEGSWGGILCDFKDQNI